MPPLPRLHIGAIRDLERQLRFAPPAALRKQIERIESLCAELVPAPPDRTYPADWLVFRVTGYRTDVPRAAAESSSAGGAEEGASGLLVGGALLADLGVLVERLCATVGFQEEELRPAAGTAGAAEWLDAAGVCARWGVSRKSLDRYRREGLTARRVAMPTGRTQLFFRRDHVEGFERVHAERLSAARGFSRMGPEMEARIVRLAERYRTRLGWSRSQAARRLAERFGRSHEAIRVLLRRRAGGDARRVGGKPGHKAEPGPLTPRQTRFISRAYFRGIEVERLARRLGKTKPTIYRALHVQRAERLRAIDFSPFAPMDRPPANLDAVLEHPAARLIVGPRPPDPPARSLADLLAHTASGAANEPGVERAIATAFVWLVQRARELLAGVAKYHPSATELDRIETDLRWAAQLKIRLVISQFPLLLKSLRVHLGVDLVEVPRPAAQRLLDESIAAVVSATDGHDPTRGGRLAAPCGLAITRTVSQWQREHPAFGSESVLARAKRFTSPADVLIDDWSRRACAWQAVLDPPGSVRGRLGEASELARQLLSRRFGWQSVPSPPQTLGEAAKALGLTVHHAAAMEHRTIVELSRGRGANIVT